MPFHAGLDWGGASHAICVIDGAGQVVVRIEARHDAAGLADMLARSSASHRGPSCRSPSNGRPA